MNAISVTIPVEERLAIQELTALYAFYCDTRHYDKLFGLFAEESIFDETLTGATRVTKSRAEMAALFAEAGDRLGPMMHTCSNHIISAFSGNMARGTCHVLAEGIFNLATGPQPFRIFGYYDDHYVKESGRWYFKSRTIRPLVPTQGMPCATIVYNVPPEHLALR